MFPLKNLARKGLKIIICSAGHCHIGRKRDDFIGNTDL